MESWGKAMNSLLFIQQDVLPALLEGLVMTVKLIIASIPFGLVTGTCVALGRIYGNKPISFLCKLYVIFFKGTPLLILLFMLYFGLPSFGIALSPFAASVLGFVLCNGAYNSEYIRGAIQSVKGGQLIAAQALGMTRRQAIWNIILPQALRRAIPGCSNEMIYLIKYSSLAYMLTYIELTGAGKIVAARSFRYTLVFTVVGIMYLIMVSFASWLLSLLEKKLYIPGWSQHR